MKHEPHIQYVIDALIATALDYVDWSEDQQAELACAAIRAVREYDAKNSVPPEQSKLGGVILRDGEREYWGR